MLFAEPAQKNVPKRSEKKLTEEIWNELDSSGHSPHCWKLENYESVPKKSAKEET